MRGISRPWGARCVNASETRAFVRRRLRCVALQDFDAACARLRLVALLRLLQLRGEGTGRRVRRAEQAQKGTTLGQRCQRRKAAETAQKGAADARGRGAQSVASALRALRAGGAAGALQGAAHLGLRSIVHSVVLIAAAHATARQSATTCATLRAPGGARPCGAAQRGRTAAGRPCRRLRGAAVPLRRAATHPSPPSS